MRKFKQNLGFPDSSAGKESSCNETLVLFLGQEDPLKKGQATHSSNLGLPSWLSWKRIRPQYRRPGFYPWVGKIPWRRERIPSPVFWPGEFQGLYSPWGHKESDTTERLPLLSKVVCILKGMILLPLKIPKIFFLILLPLKIPKSFSLVVGKVSFHGWLQFPLLCFRLLICLFQFHMQKTSPTSCVIPGNYICLPVFILLDCLISLSKRVTQNVHAFFAA